MRLRRSRRTFDRSVVNEFVFNRRYRFVYCPIPKVASTTLKILMHQLEGADPAEVVGPDGKQLGALHDSRRNRLHYLFEISDAELIEMLAGDWYRFVFVRNPWTRFLSAYRNKVEAHPTRLRNPAYRDNPDRLWVGELVEAIAGRDGSPDGTVPFPEFARYAAAQDPADMDPHYRPQVLLSGFGSIDYDRVGRIEHLEADYAALAADLGIALPLPANRRPFSGSTERVEEYYDDETTELVGSLYAEDVARFGYQFPAVQESASPGR